MAPRAAPPRCIRRPAAFRSFSASSAGPIPTSTATASWRQRQTHGEKEYLTDAFAREAVGFIDKHASEPFFLYLAFNAVHTPMQATEKYLQRFPNIKDKGNGIPMPPCSPPWTTPLARFWPSCRKKGSRKTRLIFFFSDNGGPTMVGTTINGSINFPLRGSNGQLLEGGIRVPFLMAWKGKLPAGKVFDHPIISLDIYPTFARRRRSDGDAPEWKIDGVNLLPYVQGKNQPPHETLFWRFGTAIRGGTVLPPTSFVVLYLPAPSNRANARNIEYPTTVIAR